MDISFLKLKVVLLDDQVLLNTLIKRQLLNHPVIASIKTFDNAMDLFQYKELKSIDLLFLDIIMPEINGLEVIIHIRKKLKLKKIKIFVISSITEYRVIQEVLQTGANGFFSKLDSFDLIVETINNFPNLDDKPILSPSISDIILKGAFEKQITLSPREHQLLTLICEGKTAKEIAFELSLSINTVNYYTKRLMAKMEVNRTQDLIIKAIEENFYFPK